MAAVTRPGKGESGELYLVWSVADDFRGARDVTLSWFVAARPDGAPEPPQASALIRDYHAQGAPRQRILDRYVKELFTAREAALFAGWLQEAMGMEARLIPFAAPADPRLNPTGLAPATLGLGLYVPPRGGLSRPPFEAWAYYDASRRAPVAASLDEPDGPVRADAAFPLLEYA